MKYLSLILALPLVFALTAVLAWYTGLPAGEQSNENSRTIDSHQSRMSGVGVDDGRLHAALLHMERQISSHNPAPAAGKVHNAEGMDKLFRLGDQAFFGVGFSRHAYAVDWAAENPEKMYDWLVRKNQRASSETSIKFDIWAKSNLEAALSASLEIPNLKLRAQALMSCLPVLCIINPDRAEELLLQNLSIFPTDGYEPIFDGGEEYMVTWNLLLSLPPGKKKTHLQVRLLYDDQGGAGVWSDASLDQRRKWVEAGFSPYKPDRQTFEDLETMMREQAESNKDQDLAARFIQNYGDEWVKRDLAACLEWAQVHLKGEQRVSTREKLFQTGIRENFDATIRVWKTLPGGYLKKSAAKAIRRATPDARKPELDTGLLNK